MYKFCRVLFWVYVVVVSVFALMYPVFNLLFEDFDADRSRNRIRFMVMPVIFPNSYDASPRIEEYNPNRQLEMFSNGSRSFYVLWNESGGMSEGVLVDLSTSTTEDFEMRWLGRQKIGHPLR